MCDTTQKASKTSLDRFVFNDDYIARLRSNDPETWRHFDGYFRPRILAKFRARFQWSLVEDLAEDVIMAVLEKIKKGEPREAACLAGYVFKICDHKAMEKWRELHKENYADVEWEALPSKGRSPQQQSLSNETGQKVERVMRKLSPRDRDVLTAIFHDGQDRDEVCLRQGVSREQLRLILFHARERFQKEWERE